MTIEYTDEMKAYVENHLIAYIGNKRRLIPLLIKSLERCDIPDPAKATFYDPFAGTGVVSRLAKGLGFRVICNDWEPYSQVINRLYIQTDQSELDTLFQKYGGMEQIVALLNRLDHVDEKEAYISKFYCPKHTLKPDLENERLFYTQETGQRIDAIRNQIAQWYDQKPKLSSKEKKERDALLALLLYEAATRANTSGVFKGFHRGFGGMGKDALQRIMKPLRLYKPLLFNNSKRHKVFKTDANRLTKKLGRMTEVDIAYIDPPYNQHQYGSNYHLLNTIALNDKPQVERHIMVDGKKKDKSAIRKDWNETRSDYCYKQTAVDSFSDLLEHMQAHYILVSYSNDGIIDFDTMLELLSQKGKLDIVTTQYTKYRGGKQALTTQVSNIEWVLIVDTHQAANPADILAIKQQLHQQEFSLLCGKAVNSFMMIRRGFTDTHSSYVEQCYTKKYGAYTCYIQLQDNLKITDTWFEYAYRGQTKSLPFCELPFDLQTTLIEEFRTITDVDKDTELRILLQSVQAYVDSGATPEHILRLLNQVPTLFKKYNNRKALLQSLKMVQQICQTLRLIQLRHSSLVKEGRYIKQIGRIRDVLSKKLNYIPQQQTEQWRAELAKGMAEFKEVFEEIREAS
jgi:adenine-specific DNA methylase